MKYSLATRIARTVNAYKSCVKLGNVEWEAKYLAAIRQLTQRLPHGSGIDGENVIMVDRCTDSRIVISTSFHHMNDGGYYDGWTEHDVVAKASLVYGLSIDVTGRDRNDIKDYPGEVFHAALTEETED